MRGIPKCCRQQCFAVLMATGLLVVGQALLGADAKGQKLPPPVAFPDERPPYPPDKVDPTGALGTSLYIEGQFDAGVGDYRAHTQREWIINGGGTVSAVASGIQGAPCRNVAQCDDCNPCTLDTCTESVCVGGRRNGQGCTSDASCEGICGGGVNDTGTCTNDLDCCGDGVAILDGVCNFNPCAPLTTGGAEGTGGFQCVNALLPNGQFFTDGECNDGLECNGLETCDNATGTCIAGAPLVAFVPRCDAGSNVGLACDPGGDPNMECPPAAGEQDPGACVPTPFTCEDLEQVCDEAQNSCRVSCLTDAECDEDGSACTLDRCDVRTCVGGGDDGQVCRLNAECDLGDCSGGGTGACVVDPNPCGPNAGCVDGSVCVGGDNVGAACLTFDDCGLGGSCPPTGTCVGGDDDGLSCASDSACQGVGVCVGNLGCPTGRCCQGSSCTQLNFEDCTAAGGFWRFTSTACETLDSENFNGCPSVGSGIAPNGNSVVNVGTVVGPSRASCIGSDFDRIGDDYKIGDGIGFAEVTMIRFNILEITGTRLFIEFWDTTTTPASPIFIADTLTGGVGTGTNFFQFAPPIPVPKTGVVAISVARAFTDGGSFAWRSTGSSCFNPEGADHGDTCVTNVDCTDGGTCLPPVDTGDNDPNVMFLDGQLVTNFLGQCSGGASDGNMCDFRAGDLGCPDGTCVDVPDILRYELVTTDRGDPRGGCCDSNVGSCSQELPWVCIDQGNVFRGIGIGCAVCIGGDNVGFECTSDVQCTGGGTCSELLCQNDPQVACVTDDDCGAAGPCVAIAQCSVQACCDPDGSCTEVQGLGSTCPPGTNGLGFASGCSEIFVAGASPNACPQPPPFPGGDTCRDVIVQEIPLSSNPQIPTTVTVTGNNSAATFAEYNSGTCAGGARHGLSCDPNAADLAAECPVNPNLAADTGTCERLCDSNFFAEVSVGGSGDPGWWDGFHISECANVRLDTCSTIPIVRPQWIFIMAPGIGNCCGAQINNVRAEAPVGTGEGGSQRGIPFCKEDNLWGTYPLLAPGTYYRPILSTSNSEGHAAPIVGGTGENNYQWHFTAAPCPIAACCSNLCTGGTRDGQACEPAGIEDCPGTGARCSNGSCVGGALDGFACSEACPGGGRCVEDATGLRTCVGGTQDALACLTPGVDLCPGGFCGDRSCTETNEQICGVMGGRFLAGFNFPDNRCNGGDNDGQECEVNADCPGGTCMINDPIVSCLGAPCEAGACCLGEGFCEERDPQTGALLTKVDCDAAGGLFTGGQRCLDTPRPCPTCTLTRNPELCMLHAALVPGIPGVTVGATTAIPNARDQADRLNGFEVAQANDFVARGTQLTQFCWFQYRDPAGACGSLADRWIIKFYEDDAGIPGAMLPDSPSKCVSDEICDEQQDWITPENSLLQSNPSGLFGNIIQAWDYSLTLDPPVQLVKGERYWVEVSNDGGVAGCTTWLFMANPEQDNDWKMEKFQPSDKYNVVSNNSTGPDEDGNGLSMCLDFADWDGQSIRPETPTGSCCQCSGGICTDDVTWRECMFKDISLEREIGLMSLTPCVLADDCLDLGAGGGGCPGQPSGVEGEDCVFPKVVADGHHLYNTVCSTTDGRASFYSNGGPGCDTGDPSELFLNDKWFEYHATCTGNMWIDQCRNSLGGVTVFDKMMAVYTNGTAVCPSECPPPLEFLVTGQCINGPNDMCRAPSQSTPTIGLPVVKDQCFIIRVGGEPDNADGGESVGIAVLELFCDAFTCPPSEAVELDQVVSAGGGKVTSVKNRYLSFSAGQVGREEGIRIKIIDAPPPLELWSGTVLWVGAPRQLSELSGKDDDTPPTFTTAKLECDMADAAFIDWSGLGTIHVSGPAVIPGATYEIQVVDIDCPFDDTGSFPPELARQLATGRWGDAVGAFNVAEQTWAAPNGSVDVGGDVVAILDKFKNAPTAPIKSRSDIQPSPVDSKISIVDVTRALDAFSGAQFPFVPPNATTPCP